MDDQVGNDKGDTDTGYDLQSKAFLCEWVTTYKYHDDKPHGLQYSHVQEVNQNRRCKIHVHLHNYSYKETQDSLHNASTAHGTSSLAVRFLTSWSITRNLQQGEDITCSIRQQMAL